MKWLLNDEHVRYMRLQGDTDAARRYRRKRREKYAQLLKQLEADLGNAYKDRVGDMERGRCWQEYETTATDAVRAQVSVLLLKAAFVLHLLHLPGPKEMARAACKLVRYSALGILPRNRVVPIR